MFSQALSSHIYFFIFFIFETPVVTLRLLAPRNKRCGSACFESKWVQSTELDRVNGSFCNLCALALRLALHVFGTQCWRAPRGTKQLPTVAILLYRFLSSRNVFNVVSALHYCYCLHIFMGLIRSLVDLKLEAFIVCCPLQFLVSH